MIKRFFLTLALMMAALPAFAAGTITMSLTQRFDNSTHLPLSGGLIYFIQAGTTATPQNAYQDSALTIPYANPLTLDSGGNIPQLFFADGVVKVRLTNSLGVQQLVQDNIQVTGASSGGGGGGTVDPTTIAATGDLKAAYGTSVLSGWVRANGRTIGSATSGATELASATTQSLFVYLWGADPSLAVSGGRGVSGAADFAANKTIALPDWRGRTIAGLDDMGNSAAGLLTSTYFGTSAIVLGATGGGESLQLTLGQLPTGITSSGSNSITVASARTYPATSSFLDSINNGTSSAVLFWRPNVNAATENISSSGTNSIAVTSNNTGANAHRTVQPTKLATIYVKL